MDGRRAGIPCNIPSALRSSSAGEAVSANFFQVLGAVPVLGSDFRWEDEKPGNRAVMLSYSLWQSNFGSAENIAGTTIIIDDRTFVVAGVMPKGFQFPLEKPAPAFFASARRTSMSPRLNRTSVSP